MVDVIKLEQEKCACGDPAILKIVDLKTKAEIFLCPDSAKNLMKNLERKLQ